MNILITNDDGIRADGIIELAKELAKTHNIYVVAPDTQRSATGHAITIHNPIMVNKEYIDDNISAYSISGTPADCVKIGVEALFKEVNIDMVLSGINNGPNLGTDVIYSGTVSAAIEGFVQNKPSIALSFFTIANVARFTRTELVEVLNSEYIITAKAKGLSKATVILKHALRNALIPVITVLGPLAAGLLTGSLVVEKVFAVPGIGDLLVNAINTNDLFIISGVAIIYSAFYITVILIVDVLYGVIDPRIRLAGGN